MKIIIFLLIVIAYNCFSNDINIIINSGHNGKVNKIISNTQGSIFATVSSDHTIKLWDSESGLLIRTLVGHQDEVTDLAFNITGDTIISSSKDNTLKLWDLKTGNLVSTYCCSDLFFSSVDLHPYSRIIISSTNNNELIFWSIFDNQKPIIRYKTNSNLTNVKFTKDAKHFITTDLEGNIFLYQTENPGSYLKKLNSSNSQITSFDYSKESDCLVYNTTDTIFFINLNKPENIFKFNINAEIVALSNDGKYIVYKDDKYNNIIFFNIFTQIKEFEFTLGLNELSFIKYIDFQGEPRLIASSFFGDIWYLDNFRSGNFKKISNTIDAINTMKYSSNGDFLASIINNNYLGIWRTNKLTPFKTIKLDLTIAYDFDIDPNEEIIYVAGDGFNSSLISYNLKTDQFSNFKYSEEKLITIDYDETNQLILAASLDTIFVFNTLTNEKVLSKKFVGQYIHKAIFLEKATKIAIIDNSYQVYIYDLKNGSFTSYQNPNKSNFTYILASKNKYICYLSDNSGNIFILNTDKKTIENIFSLKKKSNIYSLAIDDEEKILTLGTKNNEIIVYDLKSKKEKYIFNNAHNNIVQNLSFYKTNNLLFSSSTDGLIKLWNLENNYLDAVLYGDNKMDWCIVSNKKFIDGSSEGLKKLNWVINNKPSQVFNNYQGMLNSNLFNEILNNKLDSFAYLKDDQQAIAGLTINPKIKFINYKSYDTVKSKKIQLDISVESGSFDLSNIRIYKNDNLIDKLNIPSNSQTKYEFSYNLELSNGLNDFNFVIVDSEGFETRELFSLFNESTKTKAKSNIFILSIGISKYSNNKYNLNYAKNDAFAFLNQIKISNTNQNNEIFDYLLVDTDASKENVFNILREIADNSTENDIFILFYAGHGVSPQTDKKSNFLFTMHNSFINDEKLSVENSIDINELTEFFIKIKSQKKLAVIDACNSSEAFESFRIKQSLNSFANLTGIAFLCATSSKSAYEVHELKHGLFTYTLLDAFKSGRNFINKNITVSSLKAYLDYYLPIISKTYNNSQEQEPFGWIAGKDFSIGIAN